MADSFNVLKARTAALVKELDEARAAQEQELKNMEIERLTAQHEQHLDETVRGLKAEHKAAMEAQQANLHILQTSLVSLKHKEMVIATSLVDAQRRVAVAHDAFTAALAPTPPPQAPEADNDVSMPPPAIPLKISENASAPTLGVPQGAQFMLTPRGLKYLAPSGEATALALPSNIGVEVSYFCMTPLETNI